MKTHEQNNQRTHTIDATGRRLGDVATEAARVLQGKDQVDFTRHMIAPVTVLIENASKLDIPPKRRSKIYQWYTGYPSGRREETFAHLSNRRGYAEPVRRTVAGMLQNNRLKKQTLKNLTITD